MEKRRERRQKIWFGGKRFDFLFHITLYLQTYRYAHAYAHVHMNENLDHRLKLSTLSTNHSSGISLSKSPYYPFLNSMNTLLGV